MRRVLIVALCLLGGIGVGRFLRDDPAARAAPVREGASAAPPPADRTQPNLPPAAQLPRVHGRLQLPPLWTPASIEVRIGAPQSGWTPALFRRLRRRTMAVREDGYSFEFSDVRPGSYRLAAAIDGSIANAHASIEVLEDTVEHDLTFVVPAHDGFAVLRALGPDGEDAGALQCSLKIRGPEGSAGLAGGTRSLGGGLFLMKVPDELPKSFDSCSLRLMSKRYGEITIPYDPRKNETTVVRFETPARLTIAIVGLEASPHAPHLRIRTRPAGSTARFEEWHGASIDAQGELALPAVQPGALEVALCVEANPLFCPIAVKTVPVQPGENRAQLAIPVLHALRVARARDDVGTIGVRHLSDPPFGSYRLVRLRGAETAIERLLPGTYELSGHSAGKNWTKRVRIPQQTTIRVPSR